MKLLLKNLFFIIVVPGTVGVYLPIYYGSRGGGLNGWWNWLGLPLLAAGFAIVLWCIWDFATRGKGTPFPLDPPKNLVTGRLYRFTRNPMYAGVFLALLGWMLWFFNRPVVWYGLVVALIINLFVIFVEEPVLKKQFGKAYEDYCQKVPRWF